MLQFLGTLHAPSRSRFGVTRGLWGTPDGLPQSAAFQLMAVVPMFCCLHLFSSFPPSAFLAYKGTELSGLCACGPGTPGACIEPALESGSVID